VAAIDEFPAERVDAVDGIGFVVRAAVGYIDQEL